ncbi:MAG: hypothetical protein AAGD47_00455 [Pseudomonadota bacterium]
MVAEEPNIDSSDDFYRANANVLRRMEDSYRDMILHDGFGEMRIEVRILKRGQKEVIVHFGKQFRFVVDVS